MVRPEHLRPTQGSGLAATVNVTEPTGAETQIFASYGGQPLLSIFRERGNPTLGSHLKVQPEPGAIHLFDRDTGERLN